MFRSRRSSQSNAVRPLDPVVNNSQLILLQAARNTPTTPAAATAAAQAFLANRASNASLSSAAAAAALKTHATSPTPVSEVQTKRTQRRGSVSSNGSAQRQTLQRQGSSGSMTERTFREPSPSRPPSSRAEELPPIPAVPRNYAKQASKGKLIRRPSSAEPPQRITSPIPTNQAGRGVSLDRSGSIPKGEVPPLPTTPVLPKLNTTNERQQAANRASVNFSRPMSPQLSSPSSPTPSPLSSKQQNPKFKEGEGIISTADVQTIDHSIQDAVTRPVKKKKKKTAPQVTEGSHLSVGHSNAKPTGTAVNGNVSDVKSKRQVVDKPSEVIADPKKVTASSLQHEGESESDDSEQIPSSPERSARSAGKLTKQPSIVREDREGEELEERKAQAKAEAATVLGQPEADRAQKVEEIETQHSGKVNGTILPSTSFSKGQPGTMPDPSIKPALENGKSAATNRQLNTPFKEQKRLSWSPSRSARFSAQPVLEVPGIMKHVPPARAASPAKSALKQSPSPRIPSPSTLGLGEVSDTISLGSADGIAPGRKKKTVRVSFDDEPLVVGEGADPQSNSNSPILFSPQNKEPQTRGLFNSTRNRPDLQGDDDMMSPVPKLPSFGSIRGRREQTSENDTSASPHVFDGDEQAQKNLQQMTSSSDHAIGALLAQDSTSHVDAGPLIDPNEPLPPEVTTVEGSGYHSDTESSGDEATGNNPVKSTEFPLLENESLARDVENVPTIAVLPATPGQESIHGDRDSWLGSMPGSFPSTDQWSQESHTATETSAQPEPATPAKVGISEPEPEPVAQEQSPHTPVVGQVSESIARQTAGSGDDSDDTGDSIYSDAEEDVADLEGDGFGSIDAIVDSPAVKSSTSPLGKDLDPASNATSSTTHAKSDDENWEKARSFWSEARHGTKAESTAKQSALTTSESPSAPSKQPSTRHVLGPSNSNSPEPPAKKPSQSISPPPKSKLRDIPEAPTMRKSMRGPKPISQNESAVPLRYPVIGGSRDNEPPRLAKTLRQGPSTTLSQPSYETQGKKAPTKKRLSTQRSTTDARQDSNPVLNENAKTLRRTNEPTRQSQPLAPTKTKATPIKSFSNDSDSESSFKRARRKPANDGGRYSMKRSMRAAPAEGRPQSASFSSTSTAGPPPRSTMRERPMSTTSMGMRTSLRGPETRVTSPPPRSFGFGKSAKSGNKAPSKSRRFSNSSDEGNGPMTFRSRFADSSDEDEPSSKAPLGLTPVRGIPRRGNESDSTELDDSDDDGGKSKKKPTISLPLQSASTALASKSEGSALASGSLRNKPDDVVQQPAINLTSFRKAEPERRRSIFGGFGRKKDKPKFKPDLESAARRDTPLERTKLERSTTGHTNDSPVDIPPIPPMSPPPSRGKLQRRVTPQRVLSDTWPLPPPIPESPVSVKSERRPLTSDGSTTPRPPFGQRKISTNTEVGDGSAVGRTGKKKRFPMLRKAFGLRD